jgi:L-asparaginase
MVRVAVITTGGTFDKTYGSGAGIRDMHIGKPSAQTILLRGIFDHQILFPRAEVMRKDSLDITDGDRALIIAACQDVDTDRIIVTHGTDSMQQTAAVLSGTLVLADRTIVLTGALLPSCVRETDAELNLGLALGVCLFAPPGIYIAMNGVHVWDQCYKDSETGIFMPK